MYRWLSAVLMQVEAQTYVWILKPLSADLWHVSVSRSFSVFVRFFLFFFFLFWVVPLAVLDPQRGLFFMTVCTFMLHFGHKFHFFCSWYLNVIPAALCTTNQNQASNEWGKIANRGRPVKRVYDHWRCWQCERCGGTTGLELPAGKCPIIGNGGKVIST